MDVDHTSVCRWEINFAASVQAWRKAWFADCETWLYHVPERPMPDPSDHSCRVIRFVSHTVRGDATNTMKFKQKLHTCE
eukprot:3904329-Pyramimonas_sp.AAC.1